MVCIASARLCEVPEKMLREGEADQLRDREERRGQRAAQAAHVVNDPSNLGLFTSSCWLTGKSKTQAKKNAFPHLLGGFYRSFTAFE